MACIRCPHCQSDIPKPTNVLAWVIGLLSFFFIGGFMLIMVCLATITAIGENANQDFTVDQQIQATSFEPAEGSPAEGY